MNVFLKFLLVALLFSFNVSNVFAGGPLGYTAYFYCENSINNKIFDEPEEIDIKNYDPLSISYIDTMNRGPMRHSYLLDSFHFESEGVYYHIKSGNSPSFLHKKDPNRNSFHKEKLTESLEKCSEKMTDEEFEFVMYHLGVWHSIAGNSSSYDFIVTPYFPEVVENLHKSLTHDGQRRIIKREGNWLVAYTKPQIMGSLVNFLIIGIGITLVMLIIYKWTHRRNSKKT